VNLPVPIDATDDDALLRAAAALAWRDEPEPAVVLPTVLMRPPMEGTVGTLDYTEPDDPKSPAWPRWRISGSQHAVIMAKKLFGTDSNASDVGRTISFPATLGSFDELLLLLHRFPLEMSGPASQMFDRMYRQLVAERHIAASVPATSAGGRYFRGRLLPFQTEGVAFLCAVRKGLLADDMGLGKTVQAFGFLDRINAWPAVIVVQSHVQRHWEKKITEFMHVNTLPESHLAEGLRVVSLNGGKRFNSTPKADVYIVHYLVLHAWFEFLIERGVKTMILDEVQEARHPGTRKHEAITALAKVCENVAGLSGTPIYNHGIEMHAVMNTICRGSLGTRAAFERDWCTYVGNKIVVQDPEVLGEYLRDRKLMLRRRKDDVQLELPAKRRVIEPIAGDTGIFADMVKKAAELARQAADIADPFDRARMEAEAIRETRRATAMAKLPAVIAFLRGLLEADEPTLCFVHHHAVTDGILEALEGFKPVCITGRQDKTQKDDAMQAFARGDSNLCLISLRAATGIDGLQKRARVVVFAELDWSPAVHRQGEDRAHRMGQRDSVLVYYLVTDLGTDPFVMSTLNLKASQFTGLMQDRGETDELGSCHLGEQTQKLKKSYEQIVLLVLANCADPNGEAFVKWPGRDHWWVYLSEKHAAAEVEPVPPPQHAGGAGLGERTMQVLADGSRRPTFKLNMARRSISICRG
jgi:SWI/SNF-related matrix-associated actin-dependent regulator 1 of chromatin subfamily A